MLKELKTRPKTLEVCDNRGEKYRVKKRETYTFTVYLSGGVWIEPASTREEVTYQRVALPCVTITTEHVTLSSLEKDENGKPVRRVLVAVACRGSYCEVEQYVDTLRESGRVQSFRDGSGMCWNFIM